jgi:hypothetical protein
MGKTHAKTQFSLAARKLSNVLSGSLAMLPQEGFVCVMHLVQPFHVAELTQQPRALETLVRWVV